MSLWLNLSQQRFFTLEFNSIALFNVARTTCSIDLASAFLRQGADINSRSNVLALAQTPLLAAATHSSLQAANFMRFLLLQEANPRYRQYHAAINEQRGPLEVIKWLGITWDELVKQAKEARQDMRPNYET